MKIILGKKAGFCLGVRRAMNSVLDLSNRSEKKIYTYGPLIHNPQVVEALRDKGIEEYPEINVKNREACILIRAHGIAPSVYNELQLSGLELVDGTCPFVKSVQARIKDCSSKGKNIIIVGHEGHPEVIGLEGFIGTKGAIISTLEEVSQLELEEPITVVAQTTFDEHLWDKIKGRLRGIYKDIQFCNTICSATHERQEEIRNIAKEVDCVVIVGGKNSGNTNRLFQIASKYCQRTYYIETEKELNASMFKGVKRIGISAGASTPSWIIRRVIEKISTLRKEKTSFLFKIFSNIFEVAVFSNIYLAIGSFSMSYLVQRLLTDSFSPKFALISFFYIFSMVTINRFADKKSFKLNEPSRYNFYNNYVKPLQISALISSIISLYWAYTLSRYIFLFLFLCWLSGWFYTIKIRPLFLKNLLPISSLREIPASKTFFLAIGWAGVVVFVPILYFKSRDIVFFTYIFLYCFGLVFIRQAFFDIKDIQGDRMVGKETLPTFFGQTVTEYMMFGSIVIIFLLTSIIYIIRFISLSYLVILILPLIYTFFYYFYLRDELAISAVKRELIVDAVFILTGLAAWIKG
ncbi:MAG: 4-hydroxy-3-methylbut-2-enyl diphosphate reductase [bacterium]